MTPRGRIVTPDHRATRIGQQVLESGGSAVDAVIAASAALCVVYPQNVTLGGDSWTLVDSPGGGPVAINGTGAAPSGLSAQILIDLGLDRVPGDGPHSISVPGLVAGWGDLHAGWGRAPFADLLAPARQLAADGSPVAPALARDLAHLADVLINDPGCAQVFFADGKVLAEGDTLAVPALAKTLDLIATEGPSTLYGGEVGRRYAAGLRSAGSLITIDDLAAHRTSRVAPLSADFAGHQVVSSPPGSQGFTLLKILRLLAELGVDDPAVADDTVMVLQAVALAGRERDEILGDPEHVAVDVGRLLDPALVRRQAEQVRQGSTAAPGLGVPRPPLGGDTVGIAAVDADGCWVSSIQSVAGTFGSRVLEPATGILAHNRGSGFSLDPGQPSYLVGGRRPPHTLMPCLVRRDGRTVGALATMGGKNQPFILAQVLCRILAGDHPQAAVGAPRWVVQRPGPDDQLVVLDERLDLAVQTGLAAATTTEVVGMRDNRLGHSHAIWTAADGWAYGTDPRADGTAP